MYRIGIDVGGTFTDLVAIDGAGQVTIAKSPSTPADQSIGVLMGLEVLANEIGLTREALLRQTEQIVHGTTAATNALLERRGAKVGLLTTQGHRDVLEQREGYKPARYDLRLTPQPALVPRHLRLGVKERLRFDGSTQTPLDEASLRESIRTLQANAVEAVAICFLHSHVNPKHELRARAIVEEMMPEAYISVSSQIIREIKEYERFSTTVVNAFVGKELKNYLTNLGCLLDNSGYGNGVLIMHSHGGVGTIADSIALSAACVLSGPAGGIAAASYISSLTNEQNLISFDMGGTSTDIAIIENGRVPLSTNRDIDDLRVALPSIDIHTIGAGGGSIAHVDIGGILHVGPESAGADPGPASYGKGGQRPAVTDANVVLGYFDPKSFLGGRTSFDGAAAEKAVGAVAEALDCSVVEAAEGIQRVVNTQMAEGVRVMSVRRGVDLRNYTLLSFGGAAGLHVSDVARMLDVKRIIVPGVASVLSAWGMLATDLRYELSRSHLTGLSSADPGEIRQAFKELEQQGRDKLAQFDLGRIEIERTVDMRYGEQVFELNVLLDGVNIDASDFIEAIISRFHKRHEEVYTYKSLQQEVILVNIRVSAIGKLDAVRPRSLSRAEANGSAPTTRRIYRDGWSDVTLYRLEHLAVGSVIEGPALVESRTTTVALRDGDRATVNDLGWLDISVGFTETASLKPAKEERKNAVALQ